MDSFWLVPFGIKLNGWLCFVCVGTVRIWLQENPPNLPHLKHEIIQVSNV